MTDQRDTSWRELKPILRSKASLAVFVALAQSLAGLINDLEFEEAADEVRNSFLQTVQSSGLSTEQTLLAAGLVLIDLAMQGWKIRIRGGRIDIAPPAQVTGDCAAEKARIRRQELIKRDAQLCQPAVNEFLRSMERTRLFNGKFTSIFSLMRDGRELAENLRKAREHMNNGWANALASIIDPYLEFVISDEATCSFTGIRLMDIWRYFRHTWTNQYTSVPGRTMMFLVRDRAVPFHPIVGIGALSSPVVQIRERDTWIGWHPDTFLARAKANATSRLARWLVNVVDTAIQEIYFDDLLEDGVIATRDLTDPGEAAIRRLLEDGAAQRRFHYRYVRSRDHKSGRRDVPQSEHWVTRARTHLFRSKRAIALASYLRARVVLNSAFGSHPTSAKLVALATTGQGKDAIRRIIRKAKADRIGIAVAEITVCGAVQPYNAILGGKLVAMLAASPETVLQYRRRYSNAESEIASSMAGRAIVRTPTLVLLGTTSLYGIGSSQYNRVRIPCDRLGGSQGEVINYQKLGHSEAFGTSQYSEETVDALVAIVQQSGGHRINSIFGEGVSPKLRKVRQGLDLLGFPSDLLLRHHRQRVIYAVSLIRNLCDYLVGIESKPDFAVPLNDGCGATARVCAWWRERWLRNRIGIDEVLAEVARHTLVRPINHGARVVVPPHGGQELLFTDPL